MGMFAIVAITHCATRPYRRRDVDPTKRVKAVVYGDGVPVQVLYTGDNDGYISSLKAFTAPAARGKMARLFGVNMGTAAMAYVDIDEVLRAKSGKARPRARVLRDITAARGFTVLAKEGNTRKKFLGDPNTKFTVLFSKFEVGCRVCGERVATEQYI